MTYSETVIKDLFKVIPQKGNVEWIGVRTKKNADLSVVESIKVEKGTGLVGDHFKGTLSGKREVTLIQKEHLNVISNILGGKTINPKLTRRNIVISGINLLSLKNQQFKVGSAILETTGICAPCKKMEENLGPGGYNAMRGHGGITATVIEEGDIKLGDTVELI
tara:strand:- start:157 stop:648 length:492 start_codon:yes stop_codon:yes gene_type:complete